ncbi:MAG TPA: stage II sporulation protein M [Candidatus Scatovivens faecipullorum]|nr:stage II sporulation protein M [Candidatus Scatovivens faecipullorum]
MRKILLDYVIRNKKNFIVIVILFCIGITVGIFFINNSNEVQIKEINGHIENLINNIKNSEDINKMELLFLSIKQNVLFIILIWFLGCTILGGIFIYLAIIYKGFSIGYTISAIIATLGIKNGTIFALISLFMQNIIFIPAFFIIAENGIKLYKGIYKKCINLKEEVIRHTVIMLISIMLAIISSCIEVYFSTNLLIFLKEIL